MILGQLIVGTVLGNISSTLANRDTQRVQYEKDLQQVKVSLVLVFKKLSMIIQLELLVL